MTSTYTTNKSIEKPANGDYVNTWSIPVNNDWDIIDRSFGGTTLINAVAASGTVVLTAVQYQSPSIIISGALTANVNYQFPSTIGGNWTIYNNTSGAFSITISSGGGGTSGTIPQGYRALLNSDGTNISPAVTTSGNFLVSAVRLAGSTSGYVGLNAPAASGAVTYTLPAADGAASQFLQTNGSGILNWGTLTPTGVTTFSGGATGLLPNTATAGAITLTGTVATASGGTGQTTYTNGQLLIGNTTGNTLTKATLTAGTNVSITNGTGSITINATDQFSGTVTSVAALTLGTTGTDLSSSVANSTTTPVITLNVPTASAANRGALSAADWTTFNNKGTLTAVTGTAPVVSSGGTTPVISMAAATTSVDGYLTAANFTIFNNKASAGANTSITSLSPTGSLTLNPTTGTIVGSPTGGAQGAGTINATQLYVNGVAVGVGSGSVSSVAQTFTGGLISVTGSPITTSGTLALTVAGTSGGIPYFTSASTWATSAALAANALVVGGGAGVAPATVTTGTGVVTALGVSVGTAGSVVVNGGALGTPSSGTVTNLTGTASININGTVGATTATTGAFTTLSASSITGLTTPLSVAQGGTGAATFAAGVLKSSGTSAFTVVTAPSGAIVGTTDTQTLTGKTLSTTNTIDAGTAVSDTGTIAVTSVGFRGLPQNSQTASYTLALTDAGKHISTTTGGVIIPANASVAFPIGSSVVIFNNSAVSQTISITTDTLRLAGTTTTGSRTLAQYGLATCVKVTATVWVISGAGVT